MADEPLRILIVEDVLAEAKRARIMLDEAGIRAVVGMAHTLEEARRLLAEPPEVVLLDLGIPGAEGMEALKTVVELAPETIAIVVTGNEDQAVMLETAGFGAHDYILKSELTPEQGPDLLARAIVSGLKQRERHTKDRAIMTDIERVYEDMSFYDADTAGGLDPDPIRILYVEDNKQWPEMMARLLGPHFRVESVPRLSMAFERASRNLPDLVLLDLNLPDSKDPEETLPRMLARGFGVPIAVISGVFRDEVEEMQQKAVEAGAVGFISKDGENGKSWGAREMREKLRQRFTLWGGLGRAVKLEKQAREAIVRDIKTDDIKIAGMFDHLLAESPKARA